MWSVRVRTPGNTVTRVRSISDARLGGLHHLSLTAREYRIFARHERRFAQTPRSRRTTHHLDQPCLRTDRRCRPHRSKARGEAGRGRRMWPGVHRHIRAWLRRNIRRYRFAPRSGLTPADRQLKPSATAPICLPYAFDGQFSRSVGSRRLTLVPV